MLATPTLGKHEGARRSLPSPGVGLPLDLLARGVLVDLDHGTLGLAQDVGAHHRPVCRDDLAENPSLELAMGILLHDIGKPGTQTFSDRIRFNEHDHVGEVMVRSICRRLRFSGQQADQIADLVAQHMRFATAPRMKLGKLKGLLAMPRFDEHLELHRLDCLSSHRKLDVYDFVRQKLDEFTAEELRPDPLVDGSDLLALGYSQGPIFGRILASVREQQLDGSLNTRQEAVAYIGEHFPPVERSAQS